MRDIRHITPRYVFDRIRLLGEEYKHPDWPWLTKDAVEILEKVLKEEDRGLEFGSGRSTLWLAKRVGKIISTEDNEEWFNKVQKNIRDSGLKNVEVYFRQAEKYTESLDESGDESLDFVLVDGFARDICTQKSFNKLKSGGILIIDNINRYIPNQSRAPGSIRTEFESPAWEKLFKETLMHWKMIWTTNGVTDTLIAIKP